MKIIYAVIIILILAGMVFAQYSGGDSVLISITISTCPMMFTIDSLPTHPTLPGLPQQDTFFLKDIYAPFLGGDSLSWEATYLVGQLRSAGGIVEQAIMILDTGCVPLDFELSTYSVWVDTSADTVGSPWWTPNDSTVSNPNEYILRAIATGFNTPRLPLADTVQFKREESYYYVVRETPREIKDSVVYMGSDTVRCCFYSADLYGYDLIPTIDETGVNLQGWSSPYPQKSFYLHLALTTPTSMGTDLTHLEGMIILHIRGMAHE